VTPHVLEADFWPGRVPRFSPPSDRNPERLSQPVQHQFRYADLYYLSSGRASFRNADGSRGISRCGVQRAAGSHSNMRFPAM